MPKSVKPERLKRANALLEKHLEAMGRVTPLDDTPPKRTKQVGLARSFWRRLFFWRR